MLPKPSKGNLRSEGFSGHSESGSLNVL